MRNNPEKISPLKKNLTRSFFYLNAMLWFIYGIYVYYDMAVLNNNKDSADLVTIFVFVNAIAMFVCGIVFGGPKRWSYYFPLVVVILNMLLTLLNIVELFFTFVFMIDLILLVMVLPLRKNYLSKP